ncbi:nickel pincer cofactor biosynthesis protein LarB [Archaeoglobus veneficus]|uniref:1-(5-phosphoribosyl)-5-amino-4-imidazole-carboxylate (AIR) carboxylase n=1 Tax=Archaeoglobus veneficus (strain DSM 11195 / SNP6) TaxID=693661 RepID=F2KPL3_ARCVS|nr:nickel pincer cofactor biosynthesis protein LarB [Archaeoglobus veneficus]AEA47541.1 1-(5-phosphoribosyl)-5-amino-4-imidazole- carboxylate (AIR) carboxylase [Archaeoglobus veneficus SNP6]
MKRPYERPGRNELEDIEEFAKIDHGRHSRAGKPEAVFAEFKTPEEVVRIVKAQIERCGESLVTRASSEHIEAILKEFSDCDVKVNRKGRVVAIRRRLKEYSAESRPVGKVAILTAGTSDIPVAEEAAATAEFLGMEVLKFYDVGVAGIHRLIEPVKKIREAKVDAVIAIAGMEGALPSVVAGLVDRPVIAVPTSIGYGVNLNGLTTLFAMLQSCSSGVAVVNIDNGFGAAVFAYLIARTARL